MLTPDTPDTLSSLAVPVVNVKPVPPDGRTLDCVRVSEGATPEPAVVTVKALISPLASSLAVPTVSVKPEPVPPVTDTPLSEPDC